MEQTKRVKIRKRVRKRRALKDRVWVRALFVAILMVAAVIVATLFVLDDLPGLEAYMDADRTTQNYTDQSATPAPSTNDTPTGTAAADPSPSQLEGNLAQENLRVSVFGNGVKVANEGDTPIHLIRLVRNKRYGVAWCDTNADVNTEPKGSPNFSNKVDQVLQIGDSYNNLSNPACGTVGFVEVYTDQGNAAFRLSP